MRKPFYLTGFLLLFLLSIAPLRAQDSLPLPQIVRIGSDGVVTWDAVNGAQDYVFAYRLGDSGKQTGNMAITQSNTPTATGTPSSLPAPTLSVNDTTISWDKVTDAARYILQWHNGDGLWTEVPDQFVTLTTVDLQSIVEGGLEPNRAYSVRVKALAGEGSSFLDSDWSEAVSVTYSPTPTPTPTPTPLPQLAAPSGLKWDLDAFSWNKVDIEHGPDNYDASFDTNGQNCSNFSLVLSAQGAGLPTDKIECGNYRCWKRFANVCKGGTLWVKTQNVAGHDDSEKVTLTALHSSFPAVPISNCYAAGLEVYLEVDPIEYLEGSELVCTKWSTLFCYDAKLEETRKQVNGFVGTITEVLAVSKGAPSTADFFLGKMAERTIDYLGASALRNHIYIPIYIPQGNIPGFFDTSENRNYCVNPGPYLTPAIDHVQSYVAYHPVPRIYLYWRGESSLYDVVIWDNDNDNVKEVLFGKVGDEQVVQGASDVLTFHVAFDIKTNLPYFIRVRANDSEMREYGQSVKGISDWSAPIDFGTPLVQLSAPKNLKLGEDGEKENALCWDNVSNPVGFTVGKYKIWKVGFATIAREVLSDSDGRTCYHLEAVKPGQTYRVIALGNNRDVLDSPAAEFTVPL